MTNEFLLEVLYIVKHNLDRIQPSTLQKTDLRNAKANILRAISIMEDRIRKSKDPKRPEF